MDFVQAVEVFALVSGVAYVVLEILQKNAMWVVGILTGAACAASFAVTHVWASMGLNIYYVAMSAVGLVQWKKAGEKVGGSIHLAVLPKSIALWSAAIMLIGSLVMIQLLRLSADAAPRLDAITVMLSAIGTWWLAQSYLQQWLIWIVADLLSTALCISTGQYWMALLYAVYAGSAVYGYIHWKKEGVYLNSDGI